MSSSNFTKDYDGINILLQNEGTYTESKFYERWQVGPHKTNFFTRFYPAKGDAVASVIFAHGFQEHITRYDHVFHKIATEANVDVFAFDQRGWGRTVLDTEHKSRDSSYGLTNRPHQLEDLEFFINKEAERVGSNQPIFLWGHSMGGGLVLSFATSTTGLPSPKTVARLSGVISSAPIIKQTTPLAWYLRIAVTVMNKVIPWAPFPASVPNSYLTTDPKVNAVAQLDPLMKSYATIGIIHDFLAAGDQLDAEGYKHWPPALPLFVVHGTGDEVCSPIASKKFFDGVKLPTEHKTYLSIPGAYHEIHNEPRFWVEDLDAVMKFMKANLGSNSPKK